MATTGKCRSRLVRIAYNDANGTEIVEKERCGMPIGISFLDAHPLVFARLRPRSVQTTGSVNPPLPGLAAHAFEGDIAPSFSRHNDQDIAHDPVAADTKGRSVNEESIAGGRADVKRQQILLPGRSRKLNLNLLPLFALVILFEIRPQRRSHTQDAKQEKRSIAQRSHTHSSRCVTLDSAAEDSWASFLCRAPLRSKSRKRTSSLSACS